MNSIFLEIVYAFFGGLYVGIRGFLSILPIYETLSGTWVILLSYALGIPVVVFTIIGLVSTALRIFVKFSK